MVPAQKFTFQYSRVEDRLKMLINYDSAATRVDFFVTRAMLLQLIPVIEQMFIKASSSLPQPVVEKTGNLHVNLHRPASVEHATDTTTLALLASSEILLLEKVVFAWQAHEKQIRLDLYAKGVLQSQAHLNGEQFAAVMHAMMQVVPHSSWGVAPNILEI
ncbi:MAG: hypothetical protein DSZ03_02130 [Sulfurimonas sp.]|nr:MAG: hypothetical protein DSZ03_02130 [Sulfurimonas sp.]